MTNRKLYTTLLILGIILVSFNLRPAITSVGPVIGLVREDLNLANWSAGLLTTLPLVAFAFTSPVTPRISAKFSSERTLLAGMFFIFIGVVARLIPNTFILFAGTLLAGIGIAVCNVLLPGVVKEKFPNKVAFMTGVYVTSMGVFASVASGVSIPIASGLGWGWTNTLAIWAIPALLAMILWIYLIWKERNTAKEEEYIALEDSNVWKSPLAWKIAAFMGLQSFLFYVTVAWLPEMLHASGVTIATAGWMTSAALFIGLPASFLVPVIAEKFEDQRYVVLLLGCIALIGYSSLWIGNSLPLLILSIICIGITLSGSFALALAFLGMRTKSARQASALSGMAQAFGYALAAIGPMLIGLLFDISGSWTIPIITLLIVSLGVIGFGMEAGKNRYVEES
ncbi:CynX/NimT family MFS transporter [Salimicrobium halophilum]|uniref:MFS transporter, CP family, cyanate transporter n=1 Tax=Salimicrobium halophilum TaxID=86666 RepID=A0A1G8UB91_9BACI|nr:MFS transporter [Salimicrobium halophilum]SDJ51012.1 MFS transporter, CP family, cyanate transporter [Salimicrobium halophilum]